jgi:uncharacterized protein YjbI with pentapeptide repeats
MPNDEHVAMLKYGIRPWNDWRDSNPQIRPDLSDADLNRLSFQKANLIDANLVGCDLVEADFTSAFLDRADLRQASLRRAKLDDADLIDADFGAADLQEASFRQARLINAKLCRAQLYRTDFTSADLSGADLTGSYVSGAIFVDNDLSAVLGLEKVEQWAPSVIGIDTLYLSGGKIPKKFLSGSGIPDDLITYLPSLVGVEQALQFYSCFISYSHKDQEFAKRLHSRMRDEHLRVWFAPEDMKGGETLREQIDRAIQIHDRLLLVLSDDSLKSEWVMTEIRRARKTGVDEKRQKLFPIRLTDFETIQKWECFDSDTGKDLAVEVREYFIPDFSNWKDHDAFEVAFGRLLKDLRAAETTKGN